VAFLDQCADFSKRPPVFMLMFMIVGVFMIVTVPMVMAMLLGMFMGVMMVLVVVGVPMLMLVLMGVTVVMSMAMRFPMVVCEVNIELHTLDPHLLFPGDVQVVTFYPKFCQFLFELARIRPKVDQRTDKHVSADTAEKIQVKLFHGVWEC
jgi:hypothetical protein